MRTVARVGSACLAVATLLLAPLAATAQEYDIEQVEKELKAMDDACVAQNPETSCEPLRERNRFWMRKRGRLPPIEGEDFSGTATANPPAGSQSVGKVVSSGTVEGEQAALEGTEAERGAVFTLLCHNGPAEGGLLGGHRGVIPFHCHDGQIGHLH